MKMSKKLSFLLVFVLALSLCSCSAPNDYGLSFTPDDSGRSIIYFDEMERAIIVEGGIMTIEIDGETKLLEVALTDGDVLISEILLVAREDVEDEDIEITEYPDGSVEYHYDTFDLVVLNTYNGKRDICFIPKELSYYDMIN